MEIVELVEVIVKTFGASTGTLALIIALWAINEAFKRLTALSGYIRRYLVLQRQLTRTLQDILKHIEK